MSVWWALLKADPIQPGLPPLLARPGGDFSTRPQIPSPHTHRLVFVLSKVNRQYVTDIIVILLFFGWIFFLRDHLPQVLPPPSPE